MKRVWIALRKEYDKWEWLELGLTAVLLLFAFLIFYYTDYSDTLDNTVLLAESVAEGRFSEFYRYSAENISAYTTYSADYPLFLYLIFLIWNLPTVIAHLLTGFDYMMSVKALLWCKALIGLALLGSVWVLERILALYRPEKRARHQAGILFLAGSCTVLPSMVMSQYDILSVFFMLLGLYYYLKEDEKRFLLFFALAMPLKTFALFVFLPLLLLREKSLWKIALKTLAVFPLVVLGYLPFLKDPYFQICMDSQNGDAVKLFLDGSISVGRYEISLFAVVYLAVCVGCYLYRVHMDSEDSKNRCQIPVYVSLASMAALLLFIDIRSYWVILLMPFLILVVFWNGAKAKTNLLLLIGSTTAYSLYSLMTFWAYSYSGLISRLVLSGFVEFPDWDLLKYGNVQGFFAYYDLHQYAQILYSVFAAGVLLILFINRPRKSAAEEQPGSFGTERWPVFWQIGITGGMLVLLVYANLAVNGPHLIRSLDENTVYGADVMHGNMLEQTFQSPADDQVEELVFRAYNSNGRRYNRGVLRITLLEEETGQIKLEKLVSIALLRSEKDYCLRFSEIALTAGCAYTIRVEGIPGKQGREAEVCLAQTTEIGQGEQPLLVNGEPQEGCLAIRLK